MSTLDELERSVERLNRAVERLSGGMGKYGFANVYNDDVQLLLSERAELLATVERLRGVLETKLLEAKINCDGSEVSVAYADGVIDTYNAARAALTTGEAGSPIGQNDQPGLTFSEAGELREPVESA